VLGLEPTEAQRAALGAMGVGELKALRRELTRARHGPGSGAGPPAGGGRLSTEAEAEGGVPPLATETMTRR
jgi:hypothetical protein